MCVCICICICVCVCLCVCVYICVYVCRYLCACVCIHTGSGSGVGSGSGSGSGIGSGIGSGTLWKVWSGSGIGSEINHSGSTTLVLTKKNTAEFSVIFSYSVDSSLGRVPACNAGGPGWIPGRCSSIFGIWREDRLILSTLYIPVECSEEGLLGGRVTGI